MEAFDFFSKLRMMLISKAHRGTPSWLNPAAPTTPVTEDAEDVYRGGGGNGEVGQGKEEFSQESLFLTLNLSLLYWVKMLGTVPENLAYEMAG